MAWPSAGDARFSSYHRGQRDRIEGDEERPVGRPCGKPVYDKAEGATSSPLSASAPFLGPPCLFLAASAMPRITIAPPFARSQSVRILLISWARRIPLAWAKQPVSVIASFSRASAPAPLHSRHPLTSMQDGAFVSLQASSHRHLPGPSLLVSLPVPVLLWASLQGLPAPWACDQNRVP